MPAHDTALERDVAAKLLREELIGNEGTTGRFQMEARSAAALAHPHVVTIHDVGVTAAGRGFLIMELLEGLTVREELQRVQRLPPARVLQILRAVGAAVDAAHGRGLVHRDLKPENVFLGRSDTGEIPKVLDFGLARTLANGSRLTQPGLVAGTPHYMSPEHLRGDDVSPDWDLWAVTVMAFEMLTGTLPFPLEPDRPGRFDTLPATLRPLFGRAFSASPLDRPTSVSELLGDLEAALTHVCDERPSKGLRTVQE